MTLVWNAVFKPPLFFFFSLCVILHCKNVNSAYGCLYVSSRLAESIYLFTIHTYLDSFPLMYARCKVYCSLCRAASLCKSVSLAHAHALIWLTHALTLLFVNSTTGHTRSGNFLTFMLYLHFLLLPFSLSMSILIPLCVLECGILIQMISTQMGRYKRQEDMNEVEKKNVMSLRLLSSCS